MIRAGGAPTLAHRRVGTALLQLGRRAFCSKADAPVLEELFLPEVEDRGMQAQLIAELRDGFLVQQVPQDGDLLFRRVARVTLPDCDGITFRCNDCGRENTVRRSANTVVIFPVRRGFSPLWVVAILLVVALTVWKAC